MLRLRLLTTAGAVCLALYFATRPDPLWNAAAWNLFFVGLNLTQVVRLLRKRAQVTARSTTAAP